MNRLFRLFKKDRTWDFEGRCSTCAEPLDLHLLVDPPNTITMTAAECPHHPGKAMILWPPRRDVVVTYVNDWEDAYSWPSASPTPTPSAGYESSPGGSDTED